MLLHISPTDVLTDRWLAGNRAPLPELLPSMRRGGVAAVSPVGVLGDPTTATAAEGKRIFSEMVDGCVRRVVRWAPGPRRDADMSQPRLPDGFAVQVDRRVRVLGDGSALLGGSPTRLLKLAPAAQDMLSDGRLKVRDDVSAQLARDPAGRHGGPSAARRWPVAS